MSCLRDYTALWPYGSSDRAWYIHEIQLTRENSWNLGLAKYGLYDVLSNVVLLTSLWVFRGFMMVIACWWDSDGLVPVRMGICFCLQEPQSSQKWQNSWRIYKDIASTSHSYVIMYKCSCQTLMLRKKTILGYRLFALCTLITRVQFSSI